jgi:PAS domain S-box-containing protein
MTDIQVSATGDAADSGRLKPQVSTLWKPVLVFILFVMTISLTGYLVFQRYKDVIKSEKQNELGGIAELKTGQIENWMSERKGDAQAIKDDFLFVETFDRWLKQGDADRDAKSKLTRRLASLQQSYAVYGYTSVSLFDERARLRLSTSADAKDSRAEEKARLLESMRGGRIDFSDLHREKLRSGDRVEIELSAPLTLNDKGKVRTVGMILFRIDPYRFLFPLIQRWPTPSPSAESLLVRRDGDEVVFLNELRHLRNTAMAMRFPLSRSQLPAAMAVTGREGLVEGLDYREVPVVGVLGKIPGTSWFMVTKIDKAEFYAPINHLENVLWALMLLFTGAGGGMVFYWREKEKKQFENEIARQRLVKQLDYLSKFANDIILLLDEKGNIVDFNDRALEAYGYSAQEFSHLNIFDLREADFAPEVAQDLKRIHEAGALRFESIHTRKNGENFPVESSVRVVDIEGVRYQQAIIRDITMRKEAENELSRQKRFMRQVIDSDPNMIFVKDADGKILLANEATAKAYGLTTEGVVGKQNWQLVKDPELVAQYDLACREVLLTRRERTGIERSQRPDGQSRILNTIRKPLLQDDGTLSLLTIGMDITELKEAEEDLRRLNRTLTLLGECNAVLIHVDDENRLLDDICKLVVETGGYRMAWVGFAEYGQGKPVRPSAKYGHDAGYLDNAVISWVDSEQGRGPTGTAIRTGTTQVNQDFQGNLQMTPWRESALAHGYRSSIALPLRGSGMIFGALTIYAAECNAFNPAEIKLLEELAGNLAYGITALRISSERKQAETLLDNERTRLRTLVQAIPDLVWLKDNHGVYLSCNQRFEQFFGAKESDVLGKTDYDFVDKELADSFRDHDRKAMIADKASVNEEWLTFAADGYRGLFETIKTPMRDSQGRLIGVLGVARDITERITAAKAIQELNVDLAATLKAIPDILYELGPNGEFINIWTQNPALLAAQKELLLGHTVSEMLPPEAASTILSALGEAEIKGYSHGQVVRLRLHQEDSWFELSTSVKAGPGATGNRFIMLSRDITDRKRTEVELRFKNTLLTTEQEASIDGILIVDELGKIISYNRRFVEIWNIHDEIIVSGSDERAMQSVLDQLVSPQLFTQKIAHLNAHRDETSREEMVLRDDRVFECYTTPMIGPQSEYFGRIWYFHDITEQKLAAKNLAASYAQLQQLSLHMENVRAEERARIALNLHDEMGATLAALKMRVSWLASKLPAESQQLAEETVHIGELVSDGIKTLRQIVTELKPGLPDDEGFVPAVRNYLKKYQHDTKVECTLALSEDEMVLDGNQSATLFRVLQESLNNVAKHARADKVRVAITQSTRSLIMTIEDNGIGFDPEVSSEQSFGLIGIKERALMVGGYAYISSKAGEGTQVSVRIPSVLQQNKEQQA